MTWRPSPSVLLTEVQSEAVLLNTVTGDFFVLDTLGLAIYKLIEAGCDLAEMTEYLQQQFPDAMSQIPQDIQDFIDSLLAEALIQKNSGSAESSP